MVRNLQETLKKMERESPSSSLKDVRPTLGERAYSFCREALLSSCAVMGAGAFASRHIPRTLDERNAKRGPIFPTMEELFKTTVGTVSVGLFTTITYLAFHILLKPFPHVQTNYIEGIVEAEIGTGDPFYGLEVSTPRGVYDIEVHPDDRYEIKETKQLALDIEKGDRVMFPINSYRPEGGLNEFFDTQNRGVLDSDEITLVENISSGK